MGFPGQIAQGANDELADLFRRQMVEAQQQEQQRQFNARLLQDRAEMAQRGRIADTEQGQRQRIIDRQDATEAADNTSPGAINGATAEILRKSPATAGRVTQRQTLDAKPIAGTAPLDESGPQEFDVLEPTPQQAERSFEKSELRRVSGLLKSAGNESERRRVASDAMGSGINLPNALVGPTQTEIQSTRDANEAADFQRDNAEWDRRNAVNERDIRNRPRPGGLAGMSTGETSAIFKLQDDYSRDSKPYLTMRDGYQRVASAREDAAGDLSLIFAYMKMLDPNSVVRETEFANAQNAAGVPDQIRNLYNKAMTGVRLNPAQRTQFKGQARLLFADAHKNQAKVRQTYDGRSRQMGLDPKYVLDQEDAAPQEPEQPRQPMPEPRMNRTGAAMPTAAPATPKVGDVKTYPNGKQARFDGNGWAQIP
jgi:hypothetical protein